VLERTMACSIVIILNRQNTKKKTRIPARPGRIPPNHISRNYSCRRSDAHLPAHPSGQELLQREFNMLNPAIRRRIHGVWGRTPAPYLLKKMGIDLPLLMI
jgi:hypothetical protein